MHDIGPKVDVWELITRHKYSIPPGNLWILWFICMFMSKGTINSLWFLTNKADPYTMSNVI
jgi:hypothetical protein